MKQTYLGIFLCLFLALVACKKKKDETASPLTTTVDQDKQNITNTFKELNTCITAIRDAEGTKAVTDFLNVNNGDVLSRDWVVGIIDSLSKELELEDIGDNRKFDFSAHTGTYEWNSTTNDYVKTSTPTDKIIVKFPSKESQSSNNAILTISSYTDDDVVIDGTTYWLPKSIKANIVIDGVEILKVDGSAAYDDPIPINVNLSVVLKPFTYSITGNRINDNKFNATLNVTNGDGCNTKASLDFEFTHHDWYNLNLDTDVKSLFFVVEHNSLRIESFVDMLTLSAIKDPTTDQLNTYIKTNVFYNGQKIGQLETYDGADETRVRIRYKDGSYEDTEVYYKPFLDDLETILSPKFGDVKLQ